MNLVFVDVETTGLEPTVDYLLEVAIVVTDPDLSVIDNISTVVAPRRPYNEVYNLSSPFVQEMHEKSGLWWDIRRGHSLILPSAEKMLVDFMIQHFPIDGPKPPMGGSSVQFDRSFLNYHMPGLAAHFRYRQVDVSTLKELAQRWAPDVFASRPGQAEEDKAHRAYPDALATIAELRHYRDSGFIRSTRQDVPT